MGLRDDVDEDVEDVDDVLVVFAGGRKCREIIIRAMRMVILRG